MELSAFCNFISFGCRAPLLTLAPLSYVFYMSCMTLYKQATTSRVSCTSYALLTHGSTFVLGANFFVKVCFPCSTALVHALQCMCDPFPFGELRVHVQVASVMP